LNLKKYLKLNCKTCITIVYINFQYFFYNAQQFYGHEALYSEYKENLASLHCYLLELLETRSHKNNEKKEKKEKRKVFRGNTEGSLLEGVIYFFPNKIN
jgi:hypothetical protein